MGILETRDTLLLWIKSCQTHEQVNLMCEVVQDYIVNRFEGKETTLVIMSAADYLAEQMAIQNVLITKKNGWPDYHPFPIKP